MHLALVILSYFCVATSTVPPVIQDADNVTNSEDRISNETLQNRHNFSEEFLACGKLMVEPHHYKLFPNSSVYVPLYGQTYAPGYYVINNGSLYVCPPSHVLRYKEWYKEWEMEVTKSKTVSSVEGYLSSAFLILSCISLGLHVCIFVIVPEYKTLTVKNVASIAACLFVAYSLYLIGGDVRNTESCTRMAPAICYFFLASFFWMNAFAFDIWLSLNTSVKKLYKFVSKTKETVRYLIYACYSLGVPMIIVGAAVLVDGGIFGNKDFYPVFSAENCWFQNYNSFIIFFVTPYTSLTILNILLFTLSIVAILKLKTSNGKHEFSPQRRFVLCVRLAAAIGLPWIVGIIALFVRWKPLQYTFIVLTTLQGVYIFVAYNCNKKTANYLLARFKGGRKSPSPSTVVSASSPV